MRKNTTRVLALLLVLVMTLGILPVPVLAAPAEEQAPTPLLHLDMEDITDGKVTNKVDGKQFAIQGSVKEQTESGNGSKALVYDGTTTYVNVGKEYQVKNDFTTAAWVWVDSNTKERAKILSVGKTAVSGEKQFQFNIHAGSESVWFDMAGLGWGEFTQTTVANNTWNHIALVRHGAEIKLYVNGQLKETVTTEVYGDEIPDYMTDMYVGAGMNSEGNGPFSGHMLKGALDEVRLYDVALDAAQVAALAGVDPTEPDVPQKSSEKQILTFQLAGALDTVINQAARTIQVTVPEGTDLTALVPVLTISEKATVAPASGAAQDFTKPVLYTVTAEDGTTCTYVVNVNIQKEEADPYLKQDGTPAYGINEAIQGKRHWLENTEKMPVTVEQTENSLTMANGSISRTFVIPQVGGTNFYTGSYQNTYINKELMTGASFPEVYLALYDKPYGEVYDRKTIKVQPDYYYVGGNEDPAHTFVYDGCTVADACEKPFDWVRMGKSYSDPAAGEWPAPGKHVEFNFKAGPDFPAAYQGITIKVIYEMYDNCAAMKKRVEITNNGDNLIMIGRLAPEVLHGQTNMDELLYMETTYVCGADGTIPIDTPVPCNCGNEPAGSPMKDLKGMHHSCYDLGPAYELRKGESFKSFDTYELVHSTYWFEQQSRERLGMYRKLFPWITDNPLTMHNTGSLTKEIIDHAAAGGFEMIIQSYSAPDGSDQMLARDQATLDWYKEMVEYAHSKGVDIGIYQAQYTRDQYKQSTAYGVNQAGQWHTWCLASAAFDDYWDNFKHFVEYTGVDCVEIDGTYPGCACVNGEDHVNADKETDPADPSDTTTGKPSKYKVHHGYYDSKVMQWENAVRGLCAFFRDHDVYIKVPAWYYLSGGNKCGIGYEEDAWSQPRQEQLLYARQLMHNASYVRTMTMSWSHIPFAQYHGGGGSAMFTPFEDHAFDYNWVISQTIGNGVASDYRGPALYDDTVLPILQRWTGFYDRYRGIVNSDMVHISQATYGDDRTRTVKMDTLYHVNANNPGEKGLLWVYNQSDEKRTETITVPMYYTGLTDLSYPTYPVPDSMGKNVHDYGTYPPNYSWLPNVRDYEFPAVDGQAHGHATFVREGVENKDYTIDSNGNVMLEVTLEPMSFTYFTIYPQGQAPQVEVSIGAVTELKTETVQAGSVKLTWNPDVSITVKENGVEQPQHSLAVTGYEVYRNDELLGTTMDPFYVDTTAEENKTYTYMVKALVGASKGEPAELPVEVGLDKVAPKLTEHRIVNDTTVELLFSEPMAKAAAATTANYQAEGTQVTGAVLSADGCKVTLTVSKMEPMKKISLTISGLTDASQGANALPETTVELVCGYLAYYPMDGVENQKLEGQMGAEDAAVTGVTYTSGTGRNGCVYFNKADSDWADLGAGTFQGREQYTISVNVWPNNSNAAQTQAVLSAGQENTVKNDLGIYLADGIVSFRTCNDAEEKAVELTATDKLTANAWNQITVTRNGDTFTLYLNGKKQAEQTQADFGTFESKNTIRLGAMTNHAGGDRTAYYDGRMDDLQMLSIALTDEQAAGQWAQYQPYTGTHPIVDLDFENVEGGKVTNRADKKQYTFHGTVKPVQSGNQSQGLTFDGTDNHINLGSEYQLGGEFTAAAWINVATTGDNRNHKIFGRGWTTHGENEFYTCIRNGGYNIAFSNGDNAGGSLYDFDTPYLATNTWAHFAVVCDGTTVKVYLNGQLHETTGYASDLNLAGNPRQLLVGGGWNADGTGLQPDHVFKGAMDDVVLYDMALNQDAVQALMNRSTEPETYTLTVNGGTGAGDYAAGTEVTVTASVPEGKTFVKWTAQGMTLTAEQQKAEILTFAMPANAVTLTAEFEEAAHTHKGTLVPGKAATCTENGTKAYYTCDCGKAFEDENCTKEITGDLETWKVIKKLGHQWGQWTVVTEATEEAEGLEKRTCSVCQAEETRVIPKPDHKHHLIHVPEVPATEEATGMKEHWECEGCHKLFTDAEGKNEVSKEELIIPKLDPEPDPDPDPIFPVNPIRPVKPVKPEKPAAALPFVDVPEHQWYYDSVYSAWEQDLIDGMDQTHFAPDSTLTVAQAIKLAAALHQRDKLGEVTLTNGAGQWYETYVKYAIANDIIDETYADYTAAQMNAAITRSEFVKIFHGAMDFYAAINEVADNAIPDVKMNTKNAAEIYEFYRAGILTGSDEKGTFYPNSNIKRSEVATILIRMFDLSVREQIELS